MSTGDFGDILAHKSATIQRLRRSIKEALEDKDVGINYIVRTVAHVIAETRKKQFIAAHKVRESHPCAYAPVPSVLAGKRPQEGAHVLGIGLDHDSLWNKDGKPYLFTSEPYYIRKDELKSLITYCDQYDIDFQIDAESMYFPGHTIRILFKKGEVSSYDATIHMSPE